MEEAGTVAVPDQPSTQPVVCVARNSGMHLSVCPAVKSLPSVEVHL